MPETTTVVCHDVSIAGNVVKLRFVAEMALMEGRELMKLSKLSSVAADIVLRFKR